MQLGGTALPTCARSRVLPRKRRKEEAGVRTHFIFELLIASVFPEGRGLAGEREDQLPPSQEGKRFLQRAEARASPGPVCKGGNITMEH